MTQNSKELLKKISYKDVPLGTEFQEISAGYWHIKNSKRTGVYESWGARYESPFAEDVQVMVRIS